VGEVRAGDEQAPGVEVGTTLERESLLELPAPPIYAPSLELAWLLGGLAGNPGQHVTLDGFLLTDPLTGTADFALPASVLSHVEVLEAGLPASLGPTDSGALRLWLPRGEDAWRVQAGFQAAPAELRFREPGRGLEPVGDSSRGTRDSMYAGGLSASGPILPGRLWATAALGLRQAGRMTEATDYFDPMNPDLIELPGYSQWRLAYLAEVVARPVDEHELTVLALGRPAWSANITQEAYRSPEAELNAFSDGWLVGVGWTAGWTSALRQESRISFGEHTWEESPTSGCAAVDEPDCASHFDRDSGLLSGNARSTWLQRGRRLAVESSLSGRLGGHVVDQVVSGGVQLHRTWAHYEYRLLGGASYLDLSGRPHGVTRLVPGPDGEVGPAQDELTQDALGLHFEDELVYGPMRLQVGLRADLFWLNRDGQEGEVRFSHIGPHLAVAWDPLADGRSAIRLGYSRGVIDPGMDSFRSLRDTGQVTETYEYNPSTRVYDIFLERSGEGEPELLSARVDSLVPANAAHLGLWREVIPGLDLSADLVWRDLRVRMGTTKVLSDDLTIRAMARKRLASGWQALIAYTFCWWDGEREEPPTGNFMDLDMDGSGHRLTLVGSYRGPWGLSGALGLHWLPGETHTGLGGLVTHLFESANGAASRQAGEELLRLDARLAWTLEDLLGVRAEVTADLYVWLEPGDELHHDLWCALGLRYLL